MALRFIRSRLPTSLEDPLQAAISTTTLVKDALTGLTQFRYGSPLTAPISVVLLILKTAQVSVTSWYCRLIRCYRNNVLKKPSLNVVQDIQRNQAADCVALAWRATQILVDLDLKMRGRWDSAPKRMMQSLQKFEGYVLIPTLMRVCEPLRTMWCRYQDLGTRSRVYEMPF